MRSALIFGEPRPKALPSTTPEPNAPDCACHAQRQLRRDRRLHRPGSCAKPRLRPDNGTRHKNSRRCVASHRAGQERHTVALIGHPLIATWSAPWGRPCASPTMPTAFVLSEASDGAGASGPGRLWRHRGTGTGGGVVVTGTSDRAARQSRANGDTIPCPGLATTSSRARLATAERRLASKPSSLAPPWRATIGLHTGEKRAMRTTSPAR